MITLLYIFTVAVVIFVLAALWFAVYLYRRAKDMAPHFTYLADLQQKISTAIQTLASLDNELDALRKDLALAKQTIAAAEADRKFLGDNANRVESLKSQIAHTQEQLDNVNSMYDQAKQQKQDVDSLLQKALVELDGCKRELQNVSGEKQLQESKKNQLKKETEALRENIAKKEAHSGKLDTEIASKEIDLKAKSKEVEKEEKRLADLLSEKQRSLSDADVRIESKKKELESLEHELVRLKNTRNDVKSKVAQLEYELSGLSGKENSQKQKWEDLDREIKTINITNPKRYAEQEWLDAFETNLQSCNFKFDARLVRAFHTSLKVADCSPLVVLAGISGTGKSLLPELYAHAIGMNFLHVPVQPRWDGPQDLLGFYNYMEGRYKATDLARLLWQSDMYNNKKCAEKHPAMNLILLDEMNLARVEYYFSDMLSKLEVRRGLDPKNEEKRMAAEIVLEGGSSGGNDNLRRIFVGSHNLFVGTMNEDESTQSLSDKVKDRANVLRFARPRELGGAVANKEKFFNVYGNRIMSQTYWNEWLNSEQNEVPANLSGQISELNKLLSELGRPFAHRMWNTVSAYVRNYPDSKQNALIDQIEMKILPKLSGLDMTDYAIQFASLTRFIDSLGDAELSKAFENAKNRDFFTWQGIER